MVGLSQNHFGWKLPVRLLSPPMDADPSFAVLAAQLPSPSRQPPAFNPPLRVIGSLILKYREEGAGKGSTHLISPGLALFSEESWMEALPADPQFLWLYYHEYQKKQDAGQPREHPGWLGGSLHKTPVTGAALSPSNRIWSRERAKEPCARGGLCQSSSPLPAPAIQHSLFPHAV